MLPVHDLRRVFLDSRAFTPAGEEDEGLLSPDASSSPADEADDDDEPDTPDNIVIRNQKIKSLSDECAKHRNNTKIEQARADAAEAKLAALGDQSATINELRRHNAFLIAAAGKVKDLDAAWKLADHTSVTVADDGTVGSFEDVIASTLERYPYLVPDEALPALEPFEPLPTTPSGRPIGRRLAPPNANQSVLEAKFPALKRMR